MQTGPEFSAQDSHQDGSGHLCGLQKHWTVQLGAHPEPSGGQEKRSPSLQIHSFAPTWVQRETGLFSLGPFSPSLLLSSSMFVEEGWFLLNFSVFP